MSFPEAAAERIVPSYTIPPEAKSTSISSMPARRGRPSATGLTNGENVERKSGGECAGWRALAGFAANAFDPCKWLNLTKMVEISRCDFRNFSAPQRFQCIEEISKESLNRREEKSGVQIRRWL